MYIWVITIGHIHIYENFVPTQFIHGESTGQGPRAPKALLSALYTQAILEPLIRFAPLYTSLVTRVDPMVGN